MSTWLGAGFLLQLPLRLNDAVKRNETLEIYKKVQNDFTTNVLLSCSHVIHLASQQKLSHLRFLLQCLPRTLECRLWWRLQCCWPGICRTHTSLKFHSRWDQVDQLECKNTSSELQVVTWEVSFRTKDWENKTIWFVLFIKLKFITKIKSRHLDKWVNTKNQFSPGHSK